MNTLGSNGARGGWVTVLVYLDEELDEECGGKEENSASSVQNAQLCYITYSDYAPLFCIF